MDGILRVCNLSNRVYLGDIPKTTEDIVNSILSKEIKQEKPDIIVFPMYCLTGAYCGRVLYNKEIVRLCLGAVEFIRKETAKVDSFIIIGSVILDKGVPTSALYVLQHGEIIKVVTGNDVFMLSYADANVLISAYDGKVNLFSLFSLLHRYSADVLLLSCDVNSVAGSFGALTDTVKFYSKELSCGISLCNGGAGDSSFPYVNKGLSISASCGTILSSDSSLTNAFTSYCDFDIDIIRAMQGSGSSVSTSKTYDIYDSLSDLSPINDFPALPLKSIKHAPIAKDPYLSGDKQSSDSYLDDLFMLAASSLHRRLANINLDRMILGVSGGLDSTIALLICAKACDMLGVPHSNIIACTMPGLGTSDKTKSNAHSLMKALGCTILEIPIGEAVTQHFANIGLDPSKRDVTFENAQARERTQTLLSLANMHSGIVVGTGDLSEEALGFCTFGGDQLAQYNVNVCITKTMLRQLLSRLISTVYQQEQYATVLQAILDTPISPELLPPDEQGDISQKTEQILGPYHLHDFFLYYFVKYNFTPKRILGYATIAFADEFDEDFIKDKLSLFIKRFYYNQYKRTCAPDSAIITDICLSNENYYIPSDYNPKSILHF